MSKKDNRITVLVVEPHRAPDVKEISNTLEALQHEVGGYIQAVYPWYEPVALLCDEESKLKGAEFNRALWDENGEVYDIISGTFLIVGLTEDDFGSLSENLIKQFKECFGKPEEFINIDGRLVVLSMIVD